jgi:hypothetical protein
MTEPDVPKPLPDEVNRVWQHGMHEERLFHDRLNYFSFLETGLLTICGIMYNKEPGVAFFVPIAVVGLVFTLLWFVIQRQHWTYCVHVNERIKQLVPEYKTTLEGFAGPGRSDGLSISKPLALAVPVLFALTWVAFLVWLLIRDNSPTAPNGDITIERVGLVVLGAALACVVWRVWRLERRLK